MSQLNRNLQEDDVWAFELAPAGAGDPLPKRLARAVEAAGAEGLRVTAVRISVAEEPTLTTPMPSRVRKWLKVVGRACGLRAYWPPVASVACPVRCEASPGIGAKPGSSEANDAL